MPSKQGRFGWKLPLLALLVRICIQVLSKGLGFTGMLAVINEVRRAVKVESDKAVTGINSDSDAAHFDHLHSEYIRGSIHAWRGPSDGSNVCSHMGSQVLNQQRNIK